MLRLLAAALCASAAAFDQPVLYGSVTTLAGGGVTGTQSGSSNGVGTNALFRAPTGVIVTSGRLAVSDFNSQIRLVNLATKATTTLAGLGCSGAGTFTCGTAQEKSCCSLTTNYANGVGTAAKFNSPNDLGAVLSNGNVLVAGAWRLRVGLTSCRDVHHAPTRLAAPPSLRQPSVLPPLRPPAAPLRAAADTCNFIIREVTVPGGVVTTLAGRPLFCGAADGVGSSATFRWPVAVRADAINVTWQTWVTTAYAQ
jgi:hypothetical protein